MEILNNQTLCLMTRHFLIGNYGNEWDSLKEIVGKEINSNRLLTITPLRVL